jgi:hypothetical protein
VVLPGVDGSAHRELEQGPDAGGGDGEASVKAGGDASVRAGGDGDASVTAEADPPRELE